MERLKKMRNRTWLMIVALSDSPREFLLGFLHEFQFCSICCGNYRVDGSVSIEIRQITIFLLEQLEHWLCVAYKRNNGINIIGFPEAERVKEVIQEFGKFLKPVESNNCFNSKSFWYKKNIFWVRWVIKHKYKAHWHVRSSYRRLAVASIWKT